MPPPTFVRRAVSPIHFESAPVLPEDILCVGSDEDDSSNEDCQERRKRIEALGRRYLEGRGLLIQSASLRGPLEHGWKNPWAKPSGRGAGGGNSGTGDAGRFPQARQAGLEGRSGSRERRIGEAVTMKQGYTNGSGNDHPQRRLFPRASGSGFHEPVAKRMKHEEPQRQEKGQSNPWLKGSVADASTLYDAIGREASPTPDARERAKVISKPREPRKPQESPKRLAPYVSEVVEAASSKLASKHNGHSPRPSPHAAAPSSYSPDFKYRYARNRSASTSDKSGGLFVDAPEEIIKKERSSSLSSTSSSGSSAFAKALNAAQAKADSAGRPQSPVLSPKIDADIKRLSFTALGKPRIWTSRPSSRAGQGLNDSAFPNGNDEDRSKPPSFTKRSFKMSDKTTSLSKQSSRLSDKQMTGGDHFREMLPEAQAVPDAPIAGAPSGPSTNLLETEKQSPKFPGVDEGDSYMNLSTQAAHLKAERSFQDNILRTLKSSIEKRKANGVTMPAMQGGGVTITPPANNGERRIRAGNSPPVKSEPLVEEAMSTQAMIDGMSPFAITTIKKRPYPNSLKKRTSFALSPTETRKAHLEQSSLPSPTSPGTPPTARRYYDRSMSTSSSEHPHRPLSPPAGRSAAPRAPPSRQHSTAKPPSSGFTSFSILPNGTATQTQSAQQDGQVVPFVDPLPPPPPPPPPPTFFPSERDWDGDDDDKDANDDDDNNDSLPPHPFSPMSCAANLSSGVGLEMGNNNLGNSWRKGEEDLDVAIEEAGSFLGRWDVEAEARKEGMLGRISRGQGG